MGFTYKGLEVEYQRHLVTEDEMNQQLERLRQQTPKIKVITDRPAQNGDEVLLDYAGFCDGEQFAGGTAQQQTLVLGSGMFIPGFEDQLLGSNPGDSVTVKVTFPEKYHSEALAGKDAEFQCVIHEIREKGEYGLDDEFAQGMGIETFDQLCEQLRMSMQQYVDERGEMDLQDRLIRKAADTLDFQATEEEISKAVDMQIDVLRAQLGKQGFNPDMYCQFTGSTEETLREDARGEAVAELKVHAAVARSVELENVEVSDQEIADSLEEICKQNRISMEQLEAVYDHEFEKTVVRSVQTRKVMELIRKAAVIKEL